MHPERLMTQRCTLRVNLPVDEETAERDDYNNVVPATVTVPDVPCLFQQSQNVGQRGESGQSAEIQSESFRVLLPPLIKGLVDDTLVELQPDGIDGITLDGVPYELDGPPWRVFNPRLRRVTHVEATARRAA